MGQSLRPYLTVSALAGMILACTVFGRPTLSLPQGGSNDRVPLYPNAKQLKIEESDRSLLVADAFGSSYLRFSSATAAAWTEDSGAEVRLAFDGLMPDAEWRLESDWVGLADTVGSEWRKGDLRAIVMIVDNLDSDKIADLKRQYGISGPTPGSTLIITHLWDTAKPLPSATPTKTLIPSPTHTSEPTATPLPTHTPSPTLTPVPSPTTPPDTAPGSVLKPGEAWYQGGMEMRLKNPTFNPGCDGILGFELTIMNNNPTELVVSISGLDFSITDDAGEVYTNVRYQEGPASTFCYWSLLRNLEIRAMGAGERIDLAFQVRGEPARDVSVYKFLVFRAGRISDAAWEIEVPR